MDIVDKATRSRMMAGIKGKNTRPEMVMRRGLHGLGFRFRLHVNALPGRPDLCLRRYNALVLVQGCYWHRHENCRFATTPKSRENFWLAKFAANVERDARNHKLLKADGWRLAIIWECCLRSSSAEATINATGDWLRSCESFLELPPRFSPALQ